MKKALVFIGIVMLVVSFAAPACAEEPRRLLVQHIVFFTMENGEMESAVEGAQITVEPDVEYYEAHGLTVTLKQTIYLNAVIYEIFQIGDLSKMPPPLKVHPLPREQ